MDPAGGFAAGDTSPVIYGTRLVFKYLACDVDVTSHALSGLFRSATLAAESAFPGGALSRSCGAAKIERKFGNVYEQNDACRSAWLRVQPDSGME
jgi:hypothetical protein